MKYPRKYREKLCVICRKRAAGYSFNGKRRWDKYHNLCSECYRRLLNRLINTRSSTPVFSCEYRGV